MSDHLEGLRLILLVVAVLLRINGFVYIYMKRKEIWKGPAVVLNIFSPILALATLSVITSRNHKELSKTSTSWSVFLLIAAFLLSQLMAGITFTGTLFVSGVPLPGGWGIGPGASAVGITPVYLLSLISLYSVILLSILRLLNPELGPRKIIAGTRVLVTTKVLYLLLVPLSISIMAYGILLDRTGISPSTNPFQGYDGIVDGTAVFFSIVIVAPFIEEIFFRGHLFKLLEDKLGGNPAMIVTALLFAIVHFDPVSFLPLLVMGFIMGWARKRTGSIIPSLVMHSANNLMAFLLLLLN